MAENLNIGMMIQGTGDMQNNETIEKFCYNNDENQCDVYGGLYQWNEMMQYITSDGVQGICPPGGRWHIPADIEWCLLEQFLDPSITCTSTGWRGSDGGGKLKETGTTHWSEPNTGATNSSGFTSLPGGVRDVSGNLYDLNNGGYFWTSSQNGSSSFSHRQFYNTASAGRYSNGRTNGFSVRCMMYPSNLPPESPSNPDPAENSTDIQPNINLTWDCSDPEDGNLFYDVYFGTTNPPQFVSANQIENSFNPGLLEYGTTYYWKITARDDFYNSSDSPVWTFTTKDYFECGDQMIDLRDNQVYNTVLIAEQCWMAENLNIGTMVPGTTEMSNNQVIEKYCYDNIPDSCGIYGGLYKWDEVMQYSTAPGIQGICPEGWHVPTDNEWCIMEQTVDPSITCNSIGWRGTDCGGKLKETGYRHWLSPNTGATNSSGFTAIPGGLRNSDGSFLIIGANSYMWTSNQDGSNIWSCFPARNTAQINRYSALNYYGFSVRCLMYPSNLPPESPSNPDPADNSTDIQPNINITWECSDPEDGNLFYDIYFGITDPPQFVSANQTENAYNPGLLEYGTTYYWKITARDDFYNSVESSTWSFTTKDYFECGDLMMDIRDNQVYNTVLIGEQCWMADNLNIGTMVPGTTEMSNNQVIEKYCYDNIPDSCGVYGGLYKWDEVMQYSTTPGIQGICPDGWHVPTDNEWCIMEQTVDPSITCSSTGWRGTDCGGKLKETGYRHWLSPNTGATNSSGFTAIPGGLRNNDGSFLLIGANSYMWTSTQDGSNIWSRFPSRNNAQINRYSALNYYGFSVRCMMMNNLPPDPPTSPNPPDPSSDQTTVLNLSWSCSDPESDPLTYDVYFGMSNPPAQIVAGLTSALYDPGILLYDAVYYWKVIAHDDHGHWTSGPVWSFSTKSEWECGDQMIDSRDSQVYTTVPIGTQCWMAENLNIGAMIPGASDMANNEILEKYCYNNLESNCNLYGALYQWNEAMQYSYEAQGICPEGWNLPTDTEWCVLESFVDPTIECDITGWRGINGGTLLKAGGSSGFEAIMTGYRNTDGTFLNSGYSGEFWSSSVYGTYTWTRELTASSAMIRKLATYRNYGTGVRCFRDLPNLPPNTPSSPQPSDGATGVYINISISWVCNDLNLDPLTYDVYFGNLNPPLQVTTEQEENFLQLNIIEPATTYYWMIVAHDDHGNTTPGPVWSFSTTEEPGFNQCGDTLFDIRDGKKYKTVQIGDQCWMAENLNVGSMFQGNTPMTNNDILEKYCYGNLETNCDTLGGLYQWDEAMQYLNTNGAPGICPEGWRIPADHKWCLLEQSVDPSINCNSSGFRGTDGGTKLKHGGSSGFEGLLGGYRNSNSIFLGKNSSGYFWTSSEKSTDAWMRSLSSSQTKVNRSWYQKTFGLSVRCLLYNNLPPLSPSSPQPADSAINLPVYNVLSWSCSDPDDDPLTYDVYFGTDNPPLMVSSGQTASTFDTGALLFNTTYFWKVVAYDDYNESAEGPIWSFTTRANPVFSNCGDTLIDFRDVHTYPTVQIGNQCWMAKNLNIGTMILGDYMMNDNGIYEKYCYEDIIANCSEYGGLYQWDEMMQYDSTEGIQGICPEGWHIPRDAEWVVLINFLGGPAVAGGPLKETGTVHWNAPNLGATNLSGFTALPGGINNYLSGMFMYKSSIGRFWSSTFKSGGWNYLQLTASSAEGWRRIGIRDTEGYSTRCLSYLNNTAPDTPANPVPPDSATDISVNKNLSWACFDSEFDPIIYDVYFGTANPPQLLVSGLTDTLLDLDTLLCNTIYYWKITAHDNHGHSTTGPVWSFRTKLTPDWSCGDAFLDTRDGKIYSTLPFGNQCWMTENLDLGMMITGGSDMTNNSVAEKYCYENIEANCDLYGGLYLWNEMMQYADIEGATGLCPETNGWHIPRDREWCVLEQFVDPTISCDSVGWRGSDGGTKLQQGGSSGFDAILGGSRNSSGTFGELNMYGSYWTSTKEDNESWFRLFYYGSNGIYRDGAAISNAKGYSVRCMSYIANTPPYPPSSPDPQYGAINLTSEITLSWIGQDPEFDTLYYDVFLGLTNPPPQVSSQQNSISYYAGILIPDTTYFWQVIAFDQGGLSTPGPLWSFTTETATGWRCGDTITDTRDNQKYSTVLIGTQCWMAENLNLGNMIPGTTGMTNNDIIEKYCYNNDPVYCDTAGGLYQWNEMMQYNYTEGAPGICPAGLHLPTDQEWCTLEQFVDPTITCNSTGGRGTEGGDKLKQGGSSGFEAILGGYRASS